ncbi:MoxR family ATPase [Streptomyces montanus]|uniref:MoxR family ATPase n=1 Tax=Streptomyces montanus TaxID=2580423 RepID=A0A5R9FJQ0_9ACTN|nr:MoxR family ATPase [Streptomyces montanus]TLS42759.1 MoxR family ATPase [Streptomyces montanus]
MTGVTDTRQRAEGDGWRIFRGDGQVREVVMPEPPPWRRFGHDDTSQPGTAPSDPHRPYLIDQPQIDVVNAALHLRRPLLVTGHPGTGKSSLAHAIAHEMALGKVLRWPVNSRSTLAEALYQYDAVGRLRETSLSHDRGEQPPDIGQFIRLGPLGTALVPSDHPRVLLIDELDKGDVDLPNDLLTVFEEGEFEITELSRLPAGQDRALVHTAHGADPQLVVGGFVRCREFPVVVITSNGEREFPPAFLRRCLRLDLPDPDERRLRAIVAAHLGSDAVSQVDDLIRTFLARRAPGELATDQLLNAAHLRLGGVDLDAEGLLEAVLHQLGGAV